MAGPKFGQLAISPKMGAPSSKSKIALVDCRSQTPYILTAIWALKGTPQLSWGRLLS